MRLKILDAVDCQVTHASREEMAWLTRLLSYRAEIYIKRQFGGNRKTYQVSMVTKAKGQRPFFPVGLIPRLLAAAQRNNMTVDVCGKLPRLEPTGKPSVPGKKLRTDQLRLIESAVKQQRGLLVSPMGSGKTITMMGLLSCFPKARTLIVTHSKSIVTQTLAELHQHGFNASGNPTVSAPIVVATRQSVVQTAKYKYDIINGRKTNKQLVSPASIHPSFKAWLRKTDIVIIDEAHLFGDSVDGQYSLILRSTLAPIRIGLTGTAPTEDKIAMAVEGAMGGVIDEVGHDEARDAEIMADVELRLVPVPMRSALTDHKTYKEILRYGLIENRTRNRLIIEKAKELVDQNRTVLVFINQLDHGKQLEAMAQLLDLNAPFLEGATDDVTRERVKRELMSGKTRCVISSKIWREGINIPNLGAVILAGGGMAELSTLQSIGRGLRRTEGKDRAVIIDLLDPYNYLAKHTVQRISIYVDMGWL